MLRRAGLVTALEAPPRTTPINPQVAELLAVARRLLTEVLTGQAELLADLKAEAEG